MTVVFRPHVEEAMVFDDDAAYGDDYKAAFNVTWQGPDAVEISLNCGTVSHKDVLDTYRGLAEKGAEIAYAWRADRHKAPGVAKRVRTKGRFTLWEVDLEKSIKRLERACRKP